MDLPTLDEHTEPADYARRLIQSTLLALTDPATTADDRELAAQACAEACSLLAIANAQLVAANTIGVCEPV